MKKLVSFLLFVALFMILLLFYPAVSTFGWRSSGDVNVLFEFFSSLIAITAGIFILLHFFTTGSMFFLTISIGFVLMGTEELIHSIFAFNGIWSITDQNFKLTISITWLTGNIIILISFFIALLFRDRKIVPAKRGRYAVVFNIIGFICISSLTLIIFISPFISYFVQLDTFSNKLIELSLALLFFTVFLIYFNKYLILKSQSPLLWSIIAFIIFQVLVHIFVFDSHTFYESNLDSAHLLILLGYFFPVFGVWRETIQLQRTSQSLITELVKEIKDRKQTEEELRKSKNKYRSIFEKLQDVYYESSLDETILEISPSIEIISKGKYNRDDLIGKSMYDFYLLNGGRQAFLTLLKERGSVTDYEIIFKNRDGTEVPCSISAILQFDFQGTPLKIIGSIRDITDRKIAEEEIKETKGQIEELYKHLNDVRENERTGISREIHDELGQLLTALKMDLNWTMDNIGNILTVKNKLNSMIELVSGTIKKVQKISSDLRPGILDDLGLNSAIEWYCEEFEKRSGLLCHLELEEIPEINSKIQLTLFRIFQEGLTNIIRHANARNVNIKTFLLAGKIYLKISDDGIGIREERMNSKSSLGLIGMKERLKQFNGTLEIISSENKGASLVICIPVID